MHVLLLRPGKELPLLSCAVSILLTPSFKFWLALAFQSSVGFLCGRLAYESNLNNTLVDAAFRSGAVMGFLLAGNGLLVVFLTIMAYKKVSHVSLTLPVTTECGPMSRNPQSVLQQHYMISCVSL